MNGLCALCCGCDQVLSRDREEQALKLTSLMESAITSTSKPVYTYEAVLFIIESMYIYA